MFTWNSISFPMQTVMQRSLEQRIAIKCCAKFEESANFSCNKDGVWWWLFVRTSSLPMTQNLFKRSWRGQQWSPHRTTINDHHQWKCNACKRTFILRPSFECWFSCINIPFSDIKHSKKYRSRNCGKCENCAQLVLTDHQKWCRVERSYLYRRKSFHCRLAEFYT